MLFAGLVMTMINVHGNEHIKGGCILGESEFAHGRTDSQVVVDIRRYAKMYVDNFQKYRNIERIIREGINALLELDQWTQADIVEFTKQQRELLYLSVGKQLATGRVTADVLPAYARTIRKKISDIEVELGCEVLPSPPDNE